MQIDEVLISCCGWFHARHAAKATYQAGKLARYITSIPLYADVPEQYITKVPGIERLHVYGKRFLNLPFVDWNLVKKNIFERIADQYITPNLRIFHAFSEFQERCWRRADDYGIKKVIDWGTVHPGYAKQVLSDEYDRVGEYSTVKDNNEYIERTIEELKQADLVLVPSDFARDTFNAFGENEITIKINPLGIDLESFHQIPKNDNIFRVIYVGRISLLKGVHYLLQAVQELKKEIDLELLLIGGVHADFRALMEKYAGIYQHISNVPHDQLYKFYSNSSVFVFPSLLEGMGMVTAEAMACGLPCIVTHNAGSFVRDENDGFVIPIRDVEVLKEKIIFFYKHENIRKEMGLSAGKYVQKFPWERYGNQLIQHYRELLA